MVDCFEIHVKGQLDESWSDWLGGLEVKLLDNGEMNLIRVHRRSGRSDGYPEQIVRSKPDLAFGERGWEKEMIPKENKKEN